PLASAPWIRTLRGLKIAQNELGDAVIKAFLVMAPMEALQTLNLDWTGAGLGAAEVLAHRPVFGALRALVLANNQIGEAGVRLLAGSQGLARLTSLDLTCTYLERASLRSLAGCPLLGHLTELRLQGNNGLQPGDLDDLFSSPSFPALETLTVGSVE